MSSTHINGVDLWCETAGTTGSPVVMVHGSWVDHHSWDLVAPRFAESHRVLTYDRRGHSQSERPVSQGSVHEDVADLAMLIEHADMSPAHLVGNSFGASICLRLAAERPDLIRSLVVHEPPLSEIVADDPTTVWITEAFRSLLHEVVQCLDAGDMDGGARRFVNGSGSEQWDGLSSEVRETFIANAATFLDEARDPQVLRLDLERIEHIEIPVLITVGEATAPIFSPIVQRIADTIPTVSRHTFTGAGHAPHDTHPDDFMTVVTSFIA